MLTDEQMWQLVRFYKFGISAVTQMKKDCGTAFSVRLLFSIHPRTDLSQVWKKGFLEPSEVEGVVLFL